MERINVILFAALILINILASQALGAIDTRTVTLSDTPVNKLLRGVVNTFTCLLEVPASFADITRKKGLFAGFALGLADGVATSLLRLGTGLFDVVTFLIPPYNKPLLKPEYATESFKEKTNLWQGM